MIGGRTLPRGCPPPPPPATACRHLLLPPAPGVALAVQEACRLLSGAWHGRPALRLRSCFPSPHRHARPPPHLLPPSYAHTRPPCPPPPPNTHPHARSAGERRTPVPRHAAGRDCGAPAGQRGQRRAVPRGGCCTGAGWVGGWVGEPARPTTCCSARWVLHRGWVGGGVGEPARPTTCCSARWVLHNELTPMHARSSLPGLPPCRSWCCCARPASCCARSRRWSRWLGLCWTLRGQRRGARAR